VPADGPEVERLAGDRLVAATTAHIPHPYPPGEGAAWISGHEAAWVRGESVTFAVERREDGALLGAIGLRIERDHERAELGYWIGVPYWGQGYATEAARAVMDFGFDELGLNRVYARHMGSNPASGRVMEKIGMRFEGELRSHERKWGAFSDTRFYGLLHADR
jgi:RimJ/RimL family protein N-acetyltransferase